MMISELNGRIAMNPYKIFWQVPFVNRAIGDGQKRSKEIRCLLFRSIYDIVSRKVKYPDFQRNSGRVS